MDDEQSIVNSTINNRIIKASMTNTTEMMNANETMNAAEMMNETTSATEMQTPVTTVTMYSTSWCPDCHRAKLFLKQWGISWKEVNIEQTPGAAEKVMAWAKGKRVVPTILVGDRVLVNPRMRELAEAVGAEY